MPVFDQCLGHGELLSVLAILNLVDAENLIA